MRYFHIRNGTTWTKPGLSLTRAEGFIGLSVYWPLQDGRKYLDGRFFIGPKGKRLFQLPKVYKSWRYYVEQFDEQVGTSG